MMKTKLAPFYLGDGVYVHYFINRYTLSRIFEVKLGYTPACFKEIIFRFIIIAYVYIRI